MLSKNVTASIKRIICSCSLQFIFPTIHAPYSPEGIFLFNPNSNKKKTSSTSSFVRSCSGSSSLDLQRLGIPVLYFSLCSLVLWFDFCSRLFFSLTYSTQELARLLQEYSENYSAAFWWFWLNRQGWYTTTQEQILLQCSAKIFNAQYQQITQPFHTHTRANLRISVIMTVQILQMQQKGKGK